MIWDIVDPICNFIRIKAYFLAFKFCDFHLFYLWKQKPTLGLLCLSHHSLTQKSKMIMMPCHIARWSSFMPCHTKSGGVLCYTLRTLSVRPSVVRPSVCLSVIDIGIGEEWYAIASGLISFWNNRVMALASGWISFWNNRVMALDVCKKMLCVSFPCSYFSTFLPIFFKLCIVIGIGEEWYGIASGIISFRNNRVMALDSCPKCIFALYLKNE